jgi:tetratricopeptide (TPR) repeat protein
MKKTLLIFLGLLVFFSACNKNDDSVAGNSLYNKLAADSRFSLFLSKVDDEGLTPLLRSETELTVFAVPNGSETDYTAGSHIIEGKYSVEELKNLAKVTSLYNSEVDIYATESELILDGAKVIITGIEASNGIIYLLEKPFSRAVTEPVSMDAELANSMLVSANLHYAEINSDKTLITAAITDEGTSTNFRFEEFDDHTQNAGTNIIYDLWVNNYVRTLSDANSVYRTLTESPRIIAEKEALIAESKALIALTYLEYIQTWGPVVYLPPSPDPSFDKTRYSVDDVLDSLRGFLDPAIPQLAENKNISGRLNKWAGMSILGEIYLEQGDYTTARDILQVIISSNKYSLSTYTDSPINVDSEILYGIPLEAFTNINIRELDLHNYNYDLADSKLIQMYDDEDIRKKSWFEGRQVTKFSNISNYSIIRYSKVKLMYAEALAQSGDLIEAITEINQIRDRANATIYPANNLTKENVLEKILLEYQLELAFENERYSTLKRFGKYLDIMTSSGETVTEKDLLLPIPIQEVEYGVEQNPGYR